MNPHRHRFVVKPPRLACSVAVTLGLSVLCGWPQARAATVLPAGGRVVAGQAAIGPLDARALTITQGSERAVINWNSFDIAAGNAVRFVQPDAAAAVLNRVVGSGPSTIDGSLSANGRVFVLNADGVLFGRGAQVDVGALFAGTQAVSNADFMAGKGGAAWTVVDGLRGERDASRPAAPSAARVGSVAAQLARAPVELTLADGSVVRVRLSPTQAQAVVDAGGATEGPGGRLRIDSDALLDTVVELSPAAPAGAGQLGNDAEPRAVSLAPSISPLPRSLAALSTTPTAGGSSQSSGSVSGDGQALQPGSPLLDTVLNVSATVAHELLTQWMNGQLGSAGGAGGGIAPGSSYVSTGLKIALKVLPGVLQALGSTPWQPQPAAWTGAAGYRRR